MLIPVKPLEAAKSRLSLSPQEKHGLVLAMLSDLLNAVQADPRVVAAHVVTRDREVARSASGFGARPFRSRAEGLNQELTAAMTRTGTRENICIVMPDLASLSNESFGRVLSAAPSTSAAFVPDIDGTGTTMLMSPAGLHTTPCFGDGSATAHRAAAAELGEAAPVQARLDVDHLVDLITATQWGLGSYTASWLDRHRRSVDAGLRTQMEGAC